MVANSISVSLAVLTTCAFGADDLNFLVMGDWGGTEKKPYNTQNELNTAKGMNDAAGSLGAKFALALGDNFYHYGLKSVDDSRFQTTFEQTFSGSHLSSESGFKFHVVAGNHDHLGNVQAQIDYSGKSKRWNFPNFYYTFNETAPDGSTVQIVMIDTVTLAGTGGYDVDMPGNQLPGPADLEFAQTQLEWLDQTLKASTADYLIVNGHYPVYSVAEHGPTKALSPSRFPYLQKYKVSAYFCGHDHVAEHIDVGDGVQYHVIGSAEWVGSWGHDSSVPEDQVKLKAKTSGGYATVSVNKNGMVVKHYDGKDGGKLIYTAPAIAPRSKQVVV